MKLPRITKYDLAPDIQYRWFRNAWPLGAMTLVVLISLLAGDWWPLFWRGLILFWISALVLQEARTAYVSAWALGLTEWCDRAFEGRPTYQRTPAIVQTEFAYLDRYYRLVTTETTEKETTTNE